MMNVIHVTATSGADGRLLLDIPTGSAGANFDVDVVLHAAQVANGTEKTSQSAKSHESLASLYGSISNESFVAPSRGMPRQVVPLDSE